MISVDFGITAIGALKTLAEISQNPGLSAQVDTDHSVDAAGLKLIEGFEGCRLKAYLDTAGIPTIGWGNTRYLNGKLVKMGDVITQQQADDLFLKTLKLFEAQVNVYVKVFVTQNQYKALLSFHYNTGALGSSTLLKKLNAKDYQGAADQFPLWNKITKNGKKVVSDTLVKRRRSERQLFLTP